MRHVLYLSSGLLLFYYYYGVSASARSTTSLFVPVEYTLNTFSASVAGNVRFSLSRVRIDSGYYEY